MFTEDVLHKIDRSVLCWLATTSQDGVPNVSPKEIFVAANNDTLLIANVASPQSAANIRRNPYVCAAFVDILVQKGFQVFGTAQMIKKTHDEFAALSAPLLQITAGKFPFDTIFKITATRVKPILAPRYILYPETTEAEQIADAMKAYRLDEF
ncbi:MAG: pyridoxamine 5'-phosphate oxidase family protein [Cyanobacteria bacterium P01_A01_bin.123]